MKQVRKATWYLGGLMLMLGFASPLLAQVKVDPELPSYKPVKGVTGTIKSVGSDTMNNLMTYWSEGFRKHYPNVRVEIEGKGSGTATPALIEGTANFGPMSRPFKQSEINDFEAKFGYKPTQMGTSLDMLAVFVNKDNPLEGMTLEQVDAVFSKTRKLGGKSDIATWGPLGISGKASKLPIAIYGRNSASGTYGFFKEHALGKGDYKDSVKELPGSSAVVQAVASDKLGIGYSGIGYKTADVRAVPLAAQAGDEFVPAEAEYAYTGEYPLSRMLLLSVNVKPGTKLDPLRAEFLKYVFSKDGQEVVIKDGYFPLPAPVAAKMLKGYGIEVE